MINENNITTNGHKLIFVEVNENSSEFEIIHNSNDVKSKNLPILIYLRGSGAASQNLFEYGKQFELLGTITDNKVDFDVEGFVEKPRFSYEDGIGRLQIETVSHWDYINKAWEQGFNNEDSFLSLLEANNIKGKKLVCLEIKN